VKTFFWRAHLVPIDITPVRGSGTGDTKYKIESTSEKKLNYCVRATSRNCNGRGSLHIFWSSNVNKGLDKAPSRRKQGGFGADPPVLGDFVKNNAFLGYFS